MDKMRETNKLGQPLPTKPRDMLNSYDAVDLGRIVHQISDTLGSTMYNWCFLWLRARLDRWEELKHGE